MCPDDQEFVVDKCGCHLACDCRPIKKECDEFLCELLCDYGWTKDPKTGCDICRCAEKQKCEPVTCKIACRADSPGWTVDPKTGCEICECAEPNKEQRIHDAMHKFDQGNTVADMFRHSQREGGVGAPQCPSKCSRQSRPNDPCIMAPVPLNYLDGISRDFLDPKTGQFIPWSLAGCSEQSDECVKPNGTKGGCCYPYLYTNTLYYISVEKPNDTGLLYAQNTRHKYSGDYDYDNDKTDGDYYSLATGKPGVAHRLMFKDKDTQNGRNASRGIIFSNRQYTAYIDVGWVETKNGKFDSSNYPIEFDNDVNSFTLLNEFSSSIPMSVYVLPQHDGSLTVRPLVEGENVLVVIKTDNNRANERAIGNRVSRQCEHCVGIESPPFVFSVRTDRFEHPTRSLSYDKRALTKTPGWTCADRSPSCCNDPADTARCQRSGKCGVGVIDYRLPQWAQYGPISYCGSDRC